MVKTYAVNLRDFSRVDFDKLKHLVEAYPNILSEENMKCLAFLRRSLGKAAGFNFRVTKEEFRLLAIIVDIISIGEAHREYNGGILSYEEVHGLFRKLERKFVRTFKEGVYGN